MGKIQHTSEQGRWNSLGESFIALGNLLQQEHFIAICTVDEQAQELYHGVYQQVCQFCRKSRWCWGEEADYTIKEINKACNCLTEQGLRKETAFAIKFQGRCVHVRQIEIVLFNLITKKHEQLQQYNRQKESKENIAEQLVRLGEQLQQSRIFLDGGTANSEYLVVGHAGSQKEQVSGDSWGVIDLQDGRLVQILCDGMGSGTIAMEQSSLTVQLVKKLLSAGLSVRLSLNIVNTVIAEQYGALRFSTVDIAVWNLNTKKIEFYKYGASPSFVSNRKQITPYYSESLPIGIMPRVEGTILEHTMQQNDVLIMMSDGLYELTSKQFQWEEIIRCIPTTDPQLMAEYLLAIATSRSRGNQKQAEAQDERSLEADDMTILVSKLV